MIHHAVDGQSADWFKLRLGVATASEFKRVVTPTGKLSKQAVEYAYTLLAELKLGRPLDSVETQWMERGQELEDSAYSAYEFLRGVDTLPGGFITTDDGLIGCSPDRLVGDDGGLELKCTKPNTHMGYLLDPASMVQDKTPQVQGCMYVTGRKWWDLMAYHPELPEVIVRVDRDEEYITLLDATLRAFVDQVQQLKAELIAKYGAFPEIVIGAAAEEPRGDFDISDEDLDRMYPQFAER